MTAVIEAVRNILGTVIGTAGAMEWTPYQIISVGWIVFCIVTGFVRGFIRSVYSLVSIVVAIVLAVFVMKYLSANYPALNGAATMFATVIIVCFILHWIGVATKLVNKVPVIGTINRILGALAGGVAGVVTCRFVVKVLMYFGKIAAT